ncbi:hypothetical protein MMC25_001942 [Agyrium rufum]|nr:hypothetical protein [Agyrium rufum]
MSHGVFIPCYPKLSASTGSGVALHFSQRRSSFEFEQNAFIREHPNTVPQLYSTLQESSTGLWSRGTVKAYIRVWKRAPERYEVRERRCSFPISNGTYSADWTVSGEWIVNDDETTSGRSSLNKNKAREEILQSQWIHMVIQKFVYKDIALFSPFVTAALNSSTTIATQFTLSHNQDFSEFSNSSTFKMQTKPLLALAAALLPFIAALPTAAPAEMALYPNEKREMALYPNEKREMALYPNEKREPAEMKLYPTEKRSPAEMALYPNEKRSPAEKKLYPTEKRSPAKMALYPTEKRSPAEMKLYRSEKREMALYPNEKRSADSFSVDFAA